MTEEPFHSQAESTPTAAKAAVLQLAEGIRAKNSGKPASSVIPAAGVKADRERVAAILEDAMRDMAAIKNVVLAAALPKPLARGIADALDAAMVDGLLRGEHIPVTYAAGSVNCLLDLIAAKMMISLVWRMEGFEELDDAWLTANAQAWITGDGIAQDAIDNRMRWPDPAAMLKDYVAARSGSPVSITVPDLGKIRVT